MTAKELQERITSLESTLKEREKGRAEAISLVTQTKKEITAAKDELLKILTSPPSQNGKK